MNVSEQISTLIPCRHVFLLPGGGNAPLVEAFADRAVNCLHEHTATVAAEAYAQLTGLGCSLVTTGPGVTNAMTGLAAAWLDSTPLVLLSGQVKREYRRFGCRQGGFQELPNRDLTAPIVKKSLTLADGRHVKAHVEPLLKLAQFPRQGPVHIDVPLDVQTMESPPDGMFVERNKPSLPGADDAAQRCAELLRKAERPVLLIGHGARGEGIREVLEALGLPVLLTWRAADLLEEEHPLFCGRPGIAGQRGANFVQQSADLLICVGARLDLGQTGYDVSLFAPRATKFVVDVDGNEAWKHVKESPALSSAWHHAVCDGLAFLRAMLASSSCGWGAWIAWCRAAHERYRPRNAFYDALSDALRPDDVIVAGSSGTASESTLQHIRIKRGQRLICSHGLGAMGFSLPAAIGAHFATGRRVICIEGDGSFAMNAFELETVRRLGLPIKAFVIRNGGYASIVRSQRSAGYRECVPSVPDPLEAADCYNISAWVVGKDIPVKTALTIGGPAVIAVDDDCSLSTRMKTLPAGRPHEMTPALGDDEQKDMTKWCQA